MFVVYYLVIFVVTVFFLCKFSLTHIHYIAKEDNGGKDNHNAIATAINFQ